MPCVHISELFDFCCSTSDLEAWPVANMLMVWWYHCVAVMFYTNRCTFFFCLYPYSIYLNIGCWMSFFGKLKRACFFELADQQHRTYVPTYTRTYVLWMVWICFTYVVRTIYWYVRCIAYRVEINIHRQQIHTAWGGSTYSM